MFNKVVWWLSCVSGVLMWATLPIALSMINNDETPRLIAMFLLASSLASIVFSISLLVSLHAGWQALNHAAEDSDDAPFGQMRRGSINGTQAVAYMFIPLFNVYWQFVAFPGWAKQARIQEQEQGKTRTAPSPGIAVFAIVGGWLAGILLVLLPPLGMVVGVASTVAWLVIMHAMLTWSEPKGALAPERGLAYFAIVNRRIDPRLVIGAVVVLVIAALVSTASNALLMPLIYSWMGDDSPALLGQFLRSSIYMTLLAVVMVGVPAFAGSLLDIRNPWLLVPTLVPASLVASTATLVLFTLWDWDGLPEVSDAVMIAAIAVFRACGVAAVVGLLSIVRRADLSIFAGLAVVEIATLPLHNMLSTALYMLTDADTPFNLTGITYALTDVSYYTGIIVLETALIAGGLTLLHTLCGSPLVTPRSQA
jgi:hypothetical protein